MAAQIEFDVQMTCGKCVSVIETALKNKGIESFQVDLAKESVLVTTDLPTEEVRLVIEETGRKAVVKGMGAPTGTTHLGAAVAMIDTGTVQGIVRMVQQSNDLCVFDGTIDGLTPGSQYRVDVHELGDLSQGCESCGEVYPGLDGSSADYGRLGDVTSDKNGRTSFRVTSSRLQVWEMIGRSLVVTSRDQKRLGCGIIARSAGVFENSKRICACDGITVWDERNVPSAGGARNQYATANL